MDSFFVLLFLASLILLIIGKYSPEKSLFWYKHKRTVGKSSQIYGIALVICFILIGITSKENNTANSEQEKNTSQDDNISRERQQALNDSLIFAEAKRIADSTHEADSINNRLPQWVIVKSWRGNGIKKTEPFMISSGKWRIIWSYSSPTRASFLQIFCNRPGGDMYEDLVANVANDASGGETSYFYNHGEFYLDINAVDCNWKVTVEEEINP